MNKPKELQQPRNEFGYPVKPQAEYSAADDMRLARIENEVRKERARQELENDERRKYFGQFSGNW